MTGTDPVRTRWLRVDGRRVRTQVAGNGPALVIVPGLGLSGDFYRPNLVRLAATGIRAVAVDLPGFGESEPMGWTGLDAPGAAAWLEGFAEAMELEGAVWLGHSVGGQYVVELAARSPDRTRALVLAAPTGTRRRGRRTAQAAMLALAATRESFATVRAVARDYLRISPVRYLGTWLKSTRHDFIGAAARVACPFLVVGGRRDPIARPDALEALVERMPRAQLVVLAGAAHAVSRDDTGGFDRVVAEFVDRV